MSKFPILLLSGEANSGKDTVAQMVVDSLCEREINVAVVAYADPMKRFTRELFDFTKEQLWGPSETRNGIDPLFGPDEYETYRSGLRWSPLQRMLFEWGLDNSGATDFLRNEWFPMLKPHFDARTLTPRVVLQTFGTEFGRAMDRNLWVNYGTKIAQDLLSGGYRYARECGTVTDKSFPGYDLVVVTDGRFRNEVVAARALGATTWRINRPKAGESSFLSGHASEKEGRTIPAHFFDATIVNDGDLNDLSITVDDLLEDLIPEPNTIYTNWGYW